ISLFTEVFAWLGWLQPLVQRSYKQRGSAYTYDLINKRNHLKELEAAAGPVWRKVRCYLVLLFWLAWVTILATSIAIIIKSPWPVATPLKWWQESVFYQLQADQWTEAQTEGSEGMCGRTRRNKMLKFGFNISMLKKLT
uniref:Solute carrier family 3 member 2 N-terminal domain-containing protein n=1 Tax=Astatotilapia calliptera TaxID=8154 RepID=A0AAX7TNK9_ASTCA